MIHIKEFSNKKRDKEGLWSGFAVSLLEGDKDWPAVMNAVDDIGYRGGWLVTEQGGRDTQKDLTDLGTRLGRSSPSDPAEALRAAEGLRMKRLLAVCLVTGACLSCPAEPDEYMTLDDDEPLRNNA